MTVILWLTRIGLAGAFAVAASLKVANLDGTRQGVVEFGVPPRLAWAAALTLAITESAAAVLLITTPVRAGAVLAVALLATFTTVIVKQLVLNERRPVCRCFGSLSARPVGVHTVVRNVLLLSVALFVLVASPGWAAPAITTVPMSPLALISAFSLLICGGVAATAFRVVVALLRQQGQLSLRLEALEAARGVPTSVDHSFGLPVGQSVPPLPVRRLDGSSARLPLDLPDDPRPVLMVLLSGSCAVCRDLLSEVALWHDHALPVRPVVVAVGEPAFSTSAFANHPSGAVFTAERASSTRSTVAARPPACFWTPQVRC